MKSFIFMCLLVMVSIAMTYCRAEENEATDLILLDNTKPADKIECKVGACKVIALRKDSLFRSMGIREGDIIKKWNDKTLGKDHDEEFIFRSINEQKKPVAVIDRKGKEMTLRLPNER